MFRETCVVEEAYIVRVPWFSACLDIVLLEMTG